MSENFSQELSEAEVADALSLAIVSGAMVPAKGVTALPMSEAFSTATKHSDDVARSAVGLVEGSRNLSSAFLSQRVHLATVLSSAVVSGLVARQTPVSEALLELDGLRPNIIAVAAGFANQPNAETSAKFLAGTLRGEVMAGSAPSESLAVLETRSVEFAAAALELMGLVLPENPKAYEMTQVAVAGAIASEAVSGLMAQGHSASDSIRQTREQAPSIAAAAQLLTQASVVNLPSSEDWRASRPQLPAPAVPASPGMSL